MKTIFFRKTKLVLIRVELRRGNKLCNKLFLISDSIRYAIISILIESQIDEQCNVLDNTFDICGKHDYLQWPITNNKRMKMLRKVALIHPL